MKAAEKHECFPDDGRGSIFKTLVRFHHAKTEIKYQVDIFPFPRKEQNYIPLGGKIMNLTSEKTNQHAVLLSSTQKMILSAAFMALGLLLPFVTGQIPQIGSTLLPMHIPVLLCGFLCGWPYGLLVGFITPLFRSVLFGMPPIYPTAAAMAFELAAYGFFSGFFYGKFPKKISFTYFTLLLTMFLGRIIWGVVSMLLYGAMGKGFTWAMFMGGAFLNAIPGIILQILLIPALVSTFQKFSNR
jgi:thiamine transporter ThiT